jgi:hypothetical protein
MLFFPFYTFFISLFLLFFHFFLIHRSFGFCMEVCSNEDQLGVVLAHEMAHAVLGHVQEKLTLVSFVEVTSPGTGFLLIAGCSPVYFPNFCLKYIAPCAENDAVFSS